MIDPDIDRPCTNEYVCQLVDRFHDVYQHVRQHFQKAHHVQKKNYDSRISVNNYTVGDAVLSKDDTRIVGLSPKLCAAKWKGPHLVVRKISDLLFEIKNKVTDVSDGKDKASQSVNPDNSKMQGTPVTTALGTTVNSNNVNAQDNSLRRGSRKRKPPDFLVYQ